MIRVADINEVWGQIKPGLVAISAKTSPDWSLEDVRNLCESGEWLLFLDDETGAWGMATLYTCRFSGEKRLEITCACHQGKGDAIPVFMPFWIRLAQHTGATSIEVRSPRRGFERKGFRPVDTIYRMEVPNDVVF